MTYLYLLLISVFYTILFYGKKKGLSVLIFTVVLLIFTKKYLKKENLELNKKSYIYMIPIILLSATYMIFDNQVFNFFNYFGILLLYNYMIISITFKNDLMQTKILNSISLCFSTIRNAFKSFGECRSYINNKSNFKSKKIHKYLKSIFITIIVLTIIISLLATSDQIFGSMFNNLFSFVNNINNIILQDWFFKLIYMFIIFLLLLGLFYSIKNIKIKNSNFKVPKSDNLTIKMILISLNIIYLIFCIIQIKSLFFRSLPANYVYSTYARRGFFQLLFVSIINIILILYIKSNIRENKTINILNLLMIIFNYIIIFSSIYRMYLYEQAFGYTYLRLAVYCFLVYEIIILIPTIFYVFDKRIDLLNTYFIIFIIWYVTINYMNFDYIIAYNNVERYLNNRNSEIDVSYLINNVGSGGVDNILKLDGKVDDIDKLMIKEYKNTIKTNYSKDIREFNISNYHAYKKVSRFK